MVKVCNSSRHYIWKFAGSKLGNILGVEKYTEQIGADTAIVGEDGEVDFKGDAKFGQHMKYLHEDGDTKNGMVGCTQPRRVATVSVAKRVAEEMITDRVVEIWSVMLFVLKTSLDIILNGVTIFLRETLKDANLDNYR
ncbi:hypothetical protein CTI12_AA197110 [Artemisia annua]|uniref:RNA helicase n=1 Tax=Artemisia annua TaxID=35608 RepID=A0A2U1P3Y4_ARTAN|nr:hypothetical protein CTI12_AA197110 [Artemisia annua]